MSNIVSHLMTLSETDYYEVVKFQLTEKSDNDSYDYGDYDSYDYGDYDPYSDIDTDDWCRCDDECYCGRYDGVRPEFRGELYWAEKYGTNTNTSQRSIRSIIWKSKNWDF